MHGMGLAKCLQLNFALIGQCWLPLAVNLDINNPSLILTMRYFVFRNVLDVSVSYLVKY